jgi:DNA-binding transcriptional regulator YdaS (Cro superfamily)
MDKPHPLAAWMDKTRTSRAALIEMIGVKEAHLSLILSWKRNPSLPLAARIERATKGRVRASDMVRTEAAE